MPDLRGLMAPLESRLASKYCMNVHREEPQRLGYYEPFKRIRRRFQPPSAGSDRAPANPAQAGRLQLERPGQRL